MRKLIFSALGVALTMGGISSCGKSNRGKISNDWKVDSYELTEVETENNGDVMTTKTVATGNTVTVTTTDAPSGQSSTTTTETGSLNNATYTIKKDGTWTSLMDVTFVNQVGPSTVSITTVATQSGTWAFIGKSKGEDFKKNERILFNTLSSNSATTTVTKTGSVTNTTSGSSNTTYLTGESAEIYTVTESKGKELVLTSDAKQTNTSGSNSNSTATTATLRMTAK